MNLIIAIFLLLGVWWLSPMIPVPIWILLNIILIGSICLTLGI